MANTCFTALADLLFPEEKGAVGAADANATGSATLAPEDYEKKYPPRNLPDGAAVTRLGPSPTGFVHLGNLFMATVNQRLAAQNGGVFLLRIEDTDQKREVEGAVPSLVSSLFFFGVEFDEGVQVEHNEKGGRITERGDYGPYYQSARRDIYRAFARKLVLEGKAYPCFLTEDQIEAIRAKQEAAKELPGVYGSYAEWRGADFDRVVEKVRAGEPYVVRLFADHDARGGAGEPCGNETITVTDGIRGDITMPKNIMDVVILKKDGLPTYHFAHVVDDHLMRTTHVVRGEEWLSSLPVHIALFRALGFEPPVYCHTALLMKIDGGVKRKLSKRKDPELALSYYISDGYHPLAIREYLLTVINSNYEEWRLSNPDGDNKAFIVTMEKMGASGILFDLDKLQNISRDTLARIPATELAAFVINWAIREDQLAKSGAPDADSNATGTGPDTGLNENPGASPKSVVDPSVLIEHKDTLIAALDIGRGGDKPRKDLAYARQIFDLISYFFDAYFKMEDPLPDNMPENEARKLLEGYLADYDHTDDREAWFEKIRILSASHGYAPKPKDYKNSPDMYKGHVGDVSMVIRRALTGRKNAPDIYEIQQILGERRTRERIEAAIRS